MKLVAFRNFLVRDLRLRNPWNYKAPLLISFPYYIIGATGVPVSRGLLGILASFCTIVGIALIAYFINDAADIEKDRLAGRANALAHMTFSRKTLLLVSFVVIALLPWLYLPFRWQNGSLLAFELLLFVLYAFPPFRLKERGMLGLFADALYAHAIPAVLAAMTFSLMAERTYDLLTWFVVALGLWQFFLGVRNIVLHQLMDFAGDARSATKTLVVCWGTKRTSTVLKRDLVPLEIAGFGFFAIVVSLNIPVFIPTYVIYLALTVFRIKHLRRQPLPADARQMLYKYLDDFYIEWVPLLFLGYLISHDPHFLPLLLMHLLLFRNALGEWSREIKNLLGISWNRSLPWRVVRWGNK